MPAPGPVPALMFLEMPQAWLIVLNVFGLPTSGLLSLVRFLPSWCEQGNLLVIIYKRSCLKNPPKAPFRKDIS
jgi:hypothetical protein